MLSDHPVFPILLATDLDMGHSWAAWFVDPSRNVLAPRPAEALSR